VNQFDLNQITADTNISQGQLNSRVSSDEEEESQTEVSECGSDDDKINNTSVTVTITIPHNNYDTDTTDDDDDSSSTDTYSSQTLTTITVNRKCVGYESESTVYPDTDCDEIWDDRNTDHEDTETEDDSQVTSTPDIHNKRDHDQLSCVKTDDDESWCPRCLQSDHWEDDCPLTNSGDQTLCLICSSPGHLTTVHSTQEFSLRKLVIDTFGWLSFKHWFHEEEFRCWWTQSGFTGVPISKIVIRQNSNNSN